MMTRHLSLLTLIILSFLMFALGAYSISQADDLRTLEAQAPTPPMVKKIAKPKAPARANTGMLHGAHPGSHQAPYSIQEAAHEAMKLQQPVLPKQKQAPLVVPSTPPVSVSEPLSPHAPPSPEGLPPGSPQH